MVMSSTFVVLSKFLKYPPSIATQALDCKTHYGQTVADLP